MSLQVAMKRVLAMNAAAKYRYEATIRKNHDLLEFLSASHLVVGGRGYVCDCIRALPVEAQRKAMWSAWEQFLVRWFKGRMADQGRDVAGAARSIV